MTLNVLVVIVSTFRNGENAAPPLVGVSVFELSDVPGAPPLALMLNIMKYGSGIFTCIVG